MTRCPELIMNFYTPEGNDKETPEENFSIQFLFCHQILKLPDKVCQLDFPHQHGVDSQQQKRDDQTNEKHCLGTLSQNVCCNSECHFHPFHQTGLFTKLCHFVPFFKKFLLIWILSEK